MSSLLDAEQQMSCVAILIGVHTVLDVVQLGGAIFIPVAAIWTIMAVARRNPTNARRWTGRRVDGLLGGGAAKHVAAVILPAGVILFGVGLAVPIQRPDSSCAESLGLLSVTRLLVILVGGVLLGAAWAYTLQAGWVLATLFALDVWIVFGMVMLHLKGSPSAPDALLTLAFVVHAVCMYITTLWSFHARNLSTLGQIRAGECA